jgi:hypothetical protein
MSNSQQGMSKGEGGEERERAGGKVCSRGMALWHRIALNKDPSERGHCHSELVEESQPYRGVEIPRLRSG